MREIKFRVWDKFTQTYPFIGYHVIGEVTVFNGIEQHIRETYKERLKWHIDNLKKEGRYNENHYMGTIDFWNHFIEEQFTGLHDKNGVEIYEGDIIKWFGHEVENGKQVYPVRTHVIGGEIDKWINDQHVLRNIISMQGVEIIGNIHENPELLESLNENN